MKKLLLMFAILVSGLATAQVDFSMGGNMLLADSHLGEDIQTGAGFSGNLSVDLVKGKFILGPSFSMASFGDVRAAHSELPRRDIEPEFTGGIVSGFSSGNVTFNLSYELPIDQKHGEGAFFESMISSKLKFKHRTRNIGWYVGYDYFLNKDTFYYTSQIGVGLYSRK